MAATRPATTHAQNARQSQQPAPVQAPVALLEDVLPLELSVQRAALDPGRLRPVEVVALQRVAGNQAVSQLLQTKLTVGPAHDVYEQEADRVADQVLTMPLPVGQPDPGRRAQRQIDEEEIQTKPLGDGSLDALSAQRGMSSALPHDVRAFMEPRFGADSSDVRQHTAARAIQMSQDLKARAFTHGRNIYFGAGRCDPSSAGGSPPVQTERVQAQVVQRNGDPWRRTQAAHPGAGPRPLLGARGVPAAVPAPAAPAAPQLGPKPAGPAPRPAPAAPQLGPKPAGLAPRPAPAAPQLGPKPAGPAPRPVAPMAYVAAKTHTREVAAEPQGDGAARAAVVEKGRPRTEHQVMDAVPLSDDAGAHIRGADGQVLWYRVQGAAYEYIRARKIVPMVAATAVNEEEKKDERWKATKAIGDAAATGAMGQASELFGEGLSTADEILCLWSHWLGVKDAQGGLSSAMAQEYNAVNLTESLTWAGSGILGFAGGIAKLTAKDASIWDKLQAWGNIASTAVSITGAVSQIIGTAGDMPDRGPEASSPKFVDRANVAGGSAYAVGEAIGAVMGSVGIIKAIVETGRSIMERKQGKAVSKEEWVKHAHDIGTGLLSVAKSVVRSVRAWGETIAKEGTKFAIGGVVSTGLTAAAVGVDIALASISLIEHSYYLIKQIMHYVSMKRMEARLEKELGGEEQVSQSRQIYKRGGARVATLESMLEEKKKQSAGNEQRLTRLRQQRQLISVEMGLRATGSTQARLEQVRVKEDKAEQKKANLDTDIRNIEDRIAASKQEMTTYEEQAAAQAGAAAGPLSREALRKVNLAHEIRIVDRKRIVRQLMHISADLSNITGGALNLGGVTAPAGMSLKAGALAIEASMPVTRFIKQKVHNKVAERAALGKSIDYPGKMPKFLKISEGKGAAAKESARKQQALNILQLAAGLARFAPGLQSSDRARDEAISGLRAEMTDLESIIKATGVSVSKLYSLNGKPDAQAELLYKAIAKRELFG